MSSLMFYLLCAATMAIVNMADGYVNDWDQPFDFKCPSGQALYEISSEHNNAYEDRRWDFRCRNIGNTHSCTNSGYVNEFDQPLYYSCPGNQVMVGMHSFHENHFEDRRFGFHCCDVAGKRPSGCYITDYINKWDEKITLSLPEGKAIKVLSSYHDNSYEDRRWKVTICNI